MAAKGAGKGWAVQGVQKPWLKQSQQQPLRHQIPATKLAALADGLPTDKDARYAGEVITYYKFSGYGFIKPDQADLVPGDKLFVYWKNIQSDDRFPSLAKGMRVEFGVMQKMARGQPTLAAKYVTLEGGGMVAVQDEQDSKKTFVGGQNLRYTGTLKFFSPQRGFGYIDMDDGYALDEEVPKEIRVETAEVNAGGKAPRHMKDLQVEFGIWKTQKGAFKAYNMTLPGGLPITWEALENRQATNGRAYSGTVVVWNWRQGWGFIQPEPSTVFPPAIQTKVQQALQEAKSSGKNFEHEKAVYFRRPDIVGGFKPENGAACTFQVYMDDKGVGACNVQGV